MSEQAYSAVTYRELLLTYSGHRAVAPEALLGLLDCIARLIDSRYNGKITKRYLSELRLANRLAGNHAAFPATGKAGESVQA